MAPDLVSYHDGKPHNDSGRVKEYLAIGSSHRIGSHTTKVTYTIVAVPYDRNDF